MGLLSRGSAGLVSSVITLALFIFSSSAISSAIKVRDSKTIATFRRALSVVLAGEILWVLCEVCGVIFSALSGSSYALTNAILFGAFACAGFEFLVINGAFTDSALLSAGLAVLFPASATITLRYQELATHFDFVTAAFGTVAFFAMVAFTLMLSRRKTDLGHDALTLFRAFLKTWVAGDSVELEGIIADHAEDAEVTTKVMRLRTSSGDLFLVLPGVHPGPFHPVGSYDLPGMISRAFKDIGPVMTLHRPGGHERNLATSSETLRFSEEVKAFAGGIELGASRATLYGPVLGQVGKANVSSSAFGDDLMMTISFAPLGSDDLNSEIEDQLGEFARGTSFDVSIVDAHNSIAETQESPDLADSGWRKIIEQTKEAVPSQFRVAYSHSSDVGFVGNGDLTENGVALLMMETDRKSVLILADANNSVPGLRTEAAKALADSGYSMVEICTSDSHNLAARGLTVARGYEALGEVTPIPSIVKAVVEMAKVAEKRLAPASYGSGKLVSRVKLFGTKSLEEFARLTQESSKFGKDYLRFAVATVGALLLLSLLF
jgi:putative membrane protein